MRTNVQLAGKKHQEGIALVIVLGFLSILTIMAVSFTINMRTERLTSRMYLDSARSRHLLDVALGRALSDLDYYMTNTSPALMAPDFDFYASSGNSSNVILYQNLATNYLPSGWVGAIPQAQLQTIPNPVDPAAPPIGQYAYLIANLTGFLDMNHAGLDNSRSKGRSPGEIRIKTALLSDIEDDSKWENYAISLQTRWRRIETINEFIALCGGDIIKSNLGSRSFFPVSRSLVEAQPGTSSNKIDISGGKTALQSISNSIIDGFTLSGLSVAQSRDAYNQLIDFVDNEDIIPENPGGLSAEPVPMINEIAASANLVREVLADPPNTYRFFLRDFKVSIELWYPFPIKETTPETFRLSTNINIRFSPAATANSNLRDLRNALIPTNSGSTATISPSEVSVNKRGFTSAQGNPYVIELTYPEKQFTVTDPLFANDSANIVDLAVQIDVLEVLYGDSVVDRVSNPGVSFNVRIRANNSGQSAIACVDPRLNHLSGSTHWRVETIPSIGQINPFTTSYNSGEVVGSDPVMYSRNYPLGQDKPGVGKGSVADLGYLSLGLPWRTIALYDKPGSFSVNPVLDYFSVNTSTSSIHGLVNINSRRRDILASVFLDQPIDSAPEIEPTLGQLTPEKALDFADAILQQTLVIPFDRLSKLGSIPTVYDDSFNEILTSDARIESLIRNSINLFTVRQNVLGIMLEAKVLSEDGAVTGNEKALAVVWRDPVAVNGVNETIVRYFTWLTEE